MYGPWLLFTMAVLETCFVTGLVVPSGLATSVATVLAVQEGGALAPVVLAAAAGGWVGDVTGFWIGRATGEQVLTGDGAVGAAVARRHATLSRFLGRHPVYSVTVARWVSFVRTLMPMAAGMSGLRFSTYLVYQAPGVLGWVLLYVAVGLLAGESWEVATRIVGVGGAVAFAVAGAVLWVVLRRRRRTGSGSDAVGSAEAGGEAGPAGETGTPRPTPAGEAASPGMARARDDGAGEDPC
jgi:membrane protein DedA with SNARE-associated domain